MYYKGKVMTIGDNSPYLFVYDSSSGKLDRQAYLGFTAGALFSPDGEAWQRGGLARGEGAHL